ncbi:LLM class flavin-dependent oxidoreductase [Streptomyces sp. NPDC051771]|uniref:LLM class flavin-dependent oxidoreductase n=1 Tax=Streptomyces sp. NPDC051771 TaxID=3154847 RepID=UPI0034392BEB
MRHSILLPVNATRPEQAIPFANLVKWGGAARLWQGQGLVLESHQLVNWLAGAGIRVPAGFGVSLMPYRAPYNAAIEARSVALATGHEVVAGYGPGSLAAQTCAMGRPYSSQLTACREYLTIVRDLLDGGISDREGEFFSAKAQLLPFHKPEVSLGLGVLRERMAGLAGELADVAITWMASAAYLEEFLIPALRGAKERRPEQPAKVTAYVPVALAGPDRDMAKLLRATVGGHIQFPHYQAALRRAGIRITGDGGDDDVRALVDGGIFHYGTAEEIHQRLDAYRALGVDEVVLNVTGVAALHGPRAAASDLYELLKAAP